jgi:tetraacyldisaccharide 4'-kinase
VLRIERYWSSLNAVSLLLAPLSLLFRAIASVRRLAYRLGLRRVHRFPVPVIVVGNISVGGTGKTPLVIWLAEYLRQRGWKPGIVSRGYGGRARNWPQQVRADSDTASVGDEAVLLAAAAGCPVCVGPDRPAAVEALLAHAGVDLVLSDDGMQHYALGRDLEIAVIDGVRRLGNGMLLPAGPLREPRSRLRRVDMTVVNGGTPAAGEFAMKMAQPTLVSLHHEVPADLHAFVGRRVHAVAGVGNPQRFFDLLARLGIAVTPHPFPDHHAFSAADLQFDEVLPVLMTEKDAVKCRRLACRDCWVVRVRAQPDAAFVNRLNEALRGFSDGQEAARHPGLPDL